MGLMCCVYLRAYSQWQIKHGLAVFDGFKSKWHRLYLCLTEVGPGFTKVSVIVSSTLSASCLSNINIRTLLQCTRKFLKALTSGWALLATGCGMKAYNVSWRKKNKNTVILNNAVRKIILKRWAKPVVALCILPVQNVLSSWPYRSIALKRTTSDRTKLNREDANNRWGW